MGIDGLPGEGKTFQCRTVLERIGFQIFSMSADMFESDQAGEPAKRLRGIYEEAYRYTETKNRYSAIVIDDADVAFGSWGDLYQYTVNTQLITGELMSLADASGVRIPIFMTGNDLSKLYGPLKRSGRMSFFYWQPDLLEKAKMIYFMFDQLNEDDALEFVKYVNNLCDKKGMRQAPVSFYSDLKSRQYDSSIWQQYKECKWNQADINIFMDFDITQANRLGNLHELKAMTKAELTQKLLPKEKHI